MDDIKEALKTWMLKIIATASRSEFWVMLVVIALGGLTALQQGADPLTIIIGVLTALVSGGAYTYSRTKRKLSKDETYYAPFNEARAIIMEASVVNEKAPQIDYVGDWSSGAGIPYISPLSAYPKIVKDSKYSGVLSKILPPVPTPGLVKDRMVVAEEMASTDVGMWDVLLNRFQDTFMRALERMLSMHPEYNSVEALQAAIKEYLGTTLTPQQCANVQGMLGLRWAVTSFADIRHINNIKAAAERDPKGMAWQVEQWRTTAMKWARDGVIREAADRVKNQMLPIPKREKALLEFGLSGEEIHKCQWAGGSVTLWRQIPGGTGGNYQQFDENNLVGIYEV